MLTVAENSNAGPVLYCVAKKCLKKIWAVSNAGDNNKVICIANTLEIFIAV